MKHYKPHIYLKTYPSGLKFWRVTSQRPGPWRRPALTGPYSMVWNWKLAYERAAWLNRERDLKCQSR